MDGLETKVGAIETHGLITEILRDWRSFLRKQGNL